MAVAARRAIERNPLAGYNADGAPGELLSIACFFSRNRNGGRNEVQG